MKKFLLAISIALALVDTTFAQRMYDGSDRKQRIAPAVFGDLSLQASCLISNFAGGHPV
jgi:hypothetical protein